jgi:hypothetical protein
MSQRVGHNDDTSTGLSRARIARDVARRRRVRKVPPREQAQSAASLRGRARVSPAPAAARSLRQRRCALVPVHLCYIALCANYMIFSFLELLDHHKSVPSSEETTPDMQHENVDPLEKEPAVVLRVPRRQMNGGEGFENGAVPGKLRRCIAHLMRHGAPGWRARRGRRPRDGGKRFLRGF